MTANRKRLVITLSAAIVVGVIFVVATIVLFVKSPEVKALFTGAEPQIAAGETLEAADAAQIQAAAREEYQKQTDFAGKVSLGIFIFITLLQLAALWVGHAVISTIKYSKDTVKLKLRNLENAEVFFDVPLYFGLFGTVSAFLVMTFSPQSSRLIAYSSTLIGIIFSLFLRLTLQYPLRKRLVGLDSANVEFDKIADDEEDDDADGEDE